MRKYFIPTTIIFLLIIVLLIIWKPYHWWLALLIVPLIILGTIDFFQRGDTIRRTYPLFGRLSNFLEKQRHVLQEVLLLNRTEGKPFNWIQKEIVYKRASNELISQPFGTQSSYKRFGREWMLHAQYPEQNVEENFRINVGSSLCKKPYLCSILNIGGMSFGSISKNATLALNGGAKIGGFAQNTGEGGLTAYPNEYGADLIFQFGTGYFGCRGENGDFEDLKFEQICQNEFVKMIEVKISQGAKPGFGAILPAKKNTDEIAKYRGIKAHTEIHSPAYHSSFSTNDELISFLDKLRQLSKGKPVGIKLCIGRESDFNSMIEAFSYQNKFPDFISIDGGEGGSGAANVDSLHWVGSPLDGALHLANQTLIRYGLRKEIKLFASGKIISSFDIFKVLALGADACYSARGMMFALGCVQSLKCNLNTCPTGITTMKADRVASLVISDKKQKVANYHKNTINGLKELLGASGIKNIKQISKAMIARKVNERETVLLSKLYPFDSDILHKKL
jgi:glutamate synthase domain-containing protein 2